MLYDTIRIYEKLLKDANEIHWTVLEKSNWADILKPFWSPSQGETMDEILMPLLPATDTSVNTFFLHVDESI